MQRGSDRLSVHKDDEMKRELRGMLRSGHATRAEEWHDPEPAADDDPEVAGGPVSGPGGAERQDTLRQELGRYLGRSPFPARREGLVRVLDDRHAPDPLIGLVRELPKDRTYSSVREVVAAFGDNAE